MTRYAWLALVVALGCKATAKPMPSFAHAPDASRAVVALPDAAQPATPMETGELAGHFSSPVAGPALTVTVRDAAGATRASATVPSGRVRFALPPATYRVELAPASGPPFPGCAITVAVRAHDVTFVNDSPLPRTCKTPLWLVPDKDPTFILSHRGSRADVTTKPGAYDGYRVIPCARYEVESVYAVQGLGKRPLPSDAAGKSRNLDALVDRLRARLAAACAPMDVNVGRGNSCIGDRQPNIDVYISDWRQADEVIRRLGAIIRADDLGVLFSVGLAAIDIPE